MPTENDNPNDFRTRVPPSLHENVFKVPAGYENDEFIGAVRNALKHGRTAAEKAREIATATLANEMLTEPARHRAARDAIYTATKPALQKMQDAIERLAAKVGAMTEALKGPPVKNDAANLIARSELRQALHRLDPKARREVVIKAIQSGDEETAAAVLHGPWYLANGSPEEQEQFRLDWQRMARPAEAAHLAVLKQAAEHLETGGRLLLNYSVGLTDHRLIAKAEKLEKRAAEAVQHAGTMH